MRLRRRPTDRRTDPIVSGMTGEYVGCVGRGDVETVMCATLGAGEARRVTRDVWWMTVGRVWSRIVGAPGGRRGKWLTLAAWLVAVVVFGWLAGFLDRVQDNDETNWMPAGAGSTRAAELAQREFPAGDTVALVVVYARDGGLTDADLAAVNRHRAGLAGLGDGVVVGPEESADGQAATLTVPVANARLDSGEVSQIVADARAFVGADRPDGLSVAVTGPAAARADAVQANGEIHSGLTLVTLLVVAVVLLLTYRSPVLLWVPMLCVLTGVVVAQGAAYLVGSTGAIVSGSSVVLMIVLVFGLGTDYALLLISRYRDELRRCPDRHEAMARALHGTTPAVLASAATMILAALALLAAQMNSTRGLGPVVAVAVAAALLTMTTLLPALLVALGRWVFWPRVPRPATAASAGREWAAAAELVARHPRRTWLVTAFVLVAATGGASVLQVGGLAGGDNFTRKPESAVGLEMLASHFPGGSVTPVMVYTPAGSADRVAQAVRSTPGVATVRSVEHSESGGWTRISVILDHPWTSPEAHGAVERLREHVAAEDEAAVVGGQAATLLDQNQAMNRDLAVLVPLITLTVALVLGVLLRAVLAPLLLLGCAILSAGAALGLSTVVFHALGFPRTDQTVLLFGFLFLVALGVDYTIFLMARAREEVARGGHRRGVLRALATTGGVITSAGVVLAATFLVLTITPVVLNVQLGLLVALGVLLDALIVRAVLVPALALDVGPRLWWPGRLSRLALPGPGSSARPGTRTPRAEPGPGPAASPSPD